jgi:hypothetical protein
MGDNMVDKAKEKVQDVVDKVTGDDRDDRDDASRAGRDPAAAGASDADREAQLKAAAATGGTPDLPVGDEADLRRRAGEGGGEARP